MFNLLDARGVISVTERQAYIGRVRHLPKPARMLSCKPAAVVESRGMNGSCASLW